MEEHHTIHVQMYNEPAVLQRILLTFSRRRLRIEAMQFFDVQADKPAEMQIDLHCSVEHARDVLGQLRAVVEVSQAWSESAPRCASSVTQPAPMAEQLVAA